MRIAEQKRDGAGQTHLNTTASLPGSRQAALEDDHNLIIRNIAAVPFTELYDLMRAASSAKRSEWAKQLEQLAAGPQKFAAVESFYKTLGQLDAQEAVQSILRLHDRRTIEVAVLGVMGAARESDLEKVANMAMQVPSRYRGDLRDLLIEWSEVDPPSACHFAGNHLDKVSDSGLYPLIWQWAETDPAAAKMWLESLGPEHRTDETLRGLMSGWLENDPESAMNYAVAHADDEKIGPALREMADQLYHESGDKARMFIMRLPSDTSRKQAVQAVVETATSIVLGGSRDWSRPPSEVANWLVTLPSAVWKEEVAEVLSSWARYDSAPVLTWVEQLPQASRAQVLAKYCPMGGQVQPERVYALAMNISDRELRNQALHNFVESLGTTREESLGALRKLKLPSSQKRYLAMMVSDQ